MSVVMPPYRPFWAVVEDDPMPFITEHFQRFGAFEREDIPFEGSRPTVKALASVLGAATSMVSALSDNPKPYSVRFSPSLSATSKSREVIIGVSQWLDPSLTDGQRASITAGLVYHEVGHVRWSHEWFKRIEDAYTDPFMHAWAERCLNIAHDIMLEALQPMDYPGYAGTLDPKNRYFASWWAPVETTAEDRLNVGLQRLKYPFATDWTMTSVDVSAWDALGGRMRSRSALKPKEMLAIIAGMLDIVKPDPDEPKPEGPVEPPEGPEGPEPPEGPVIERPSGKPKPEDKPKDEPGEGKGKGEPDEPKDEPKGEGEGKDDSDDAPKDEGKDDAPKDEPKAPSKPGEGKPSDLHPEPTGSDVEWQEHVDTYEKAQAKGRDLVVTGGGSFHKREVRIRRLP